jgi:hypothetical protein
MASQVGAAGDRRQRGYRLIPVGIPHMHYGRLGDTPMVSGGEEAYKSVSNEARQEAGSALVTQRDGGSVL